MATSFAPRDPPARFAAKLRRILLGTCTVALVSCGGGQSGPAAPAESVTPAGADDTGGPVVALNPPTAVRQNNRIGLTWQASSSLTSFTVLVQRAAGQAFDAVDAVVGGQSAQFSRGAAYRWDFPTARVRVRGCDTSNQCVDSNEQPLLDALLGGLAQVPAQAINSFAGLQVALSADGNTMAFNSFDFISACGTIGAVFVYQRAADGRWVREAELKPIAPSIDTLFGPLFALSGDGNTIVIGDRNHRSGEGAIHVFTRDAQHNWSPQAFIQAAVPMPFEGFGANVATSHDGNRILVADAKRLYVLEREAGQWRQAHIIEGAPGTVALVGATGLALSADGSTIAVQALFPSTVGVHVYKRCSCAAGWQRVADLRSTKPQFDQSGGDWFGRALSLSSAGDTLAVGAGRDSGDASDDGTNINFGSPDSGAVYVFAADDAGTWQRRAFLKATTAPANDQLGVRVSLSGDGKVLLAAACGQAANAAGLRRNHRAGATVGPPGFDNSACNFGGSGYVFEAGASGVWSHTAAAIAAPGERTEWHDFGSGGLGRFSLSMSADAQTSASFVTIMGDVVDGTQSGHRVVVY